MPIAIGTSGHKSRTSNTNGIDFFHEIKIAGIAIVNGVLEAKTTSPWIFDPFFLKGKWISPEIYFLFILWFDLNLL